MSLSTGIAAKTRLYNIPSSTQVPPSHVYSSRCMRLDLHICNSFQIEAIDKIPGKRTVCIHFAYSLFLTIGSAKLSECLRRRSRHYLRGSVLANVASLVVNLLLDPIVCYLRRRQILESKVFAVCLQFDSASLCWGRIPYWA
jgi:hypothetical protein